MLGKNENCNIRINIVTWLVGPKRRGKWSSGRGGENVRHLGIDVDYYYLPSMALLNEHNQSILSMPIPSLR